MNNIIVVIIIIIIIIITSIAIIISIIIIIITRDPFTHMLFVYARLKHRGLAIIGAYVRLF